MSKAIVRAYAAGTLDWVAVWLILFISVALSTYLIDPSNFEVADKGLLVTRAAILSTSVTLFYMAATWLRRTNSTVPGDILDRLPNDVPEGTTTAPGKVAQSEDS
jgi:hypothetical protein